MENRQHVSDAMKRAVVPGLRADDPTAVVHGFRSSFRSWTAEASHPRDLAEMDLAHVNPNRVEAAYLRNNLLGRRHPMMAECGGL